jgi:Ca2+-transporting ATPase
MGETEEGLTSDEVRKKLEIFGPNVLPEKKPPSDLAIFVSQVKSPLVFVLVFAGIVTFFLKDFSDSLIIGLAIFLNTILGFLQERRANNALVALKKLVHPATLVVRNGERMKVNIVEIVPGDICILGAGDKVPADGELVFANRMFVSESVLTGESVPVAKQKGDKAYMGTIVTSGRGKFLV